MDLNDILTTGVIVLVNEADVLDGRRSAVGLNDILTTGVIVLVLAFGIYAVIKVILACYAIVKTVSLYRAQAPESDGFIVVEGGLVQNSPALPVFDMDVLDSDQSVDDVFEEMFDLYERIHNHGDSRRPVDDGLMAYVPEIEEKLKLATGDNAHHLPQMLADVQEKYQRRLKRARRIE